MTNPVDQRSFTARFPVPVPVPAHVSATTRTMRERRRRSDLRHARMTRFGACMAGAAIAISALKVASTALLG